MDVAEIKPFGSREDRVSSSDFHSLSINAQKRLADLIDAGANKHQVDSIVKDLLPTHFYAFLLTFIQVRQATMPLWM